MNGMLRGGGEGDLGGLGGKEAGVLMGTESASDLGRERGLSQVEMQGGCWEEVQTSLAKGKGVVRGYCPVPPVFRLRNFLGIISFNPHSSPVSRALCVFQFYR